MFDRLLLLHFFTLFLLSLWFDFFCLLAGDFQRRLLLVSFLAVGIEYGIILIRYPFEDSLYPRD